MNSAFGSGAGAGGWAAPMAGLVGAGLSYDSANKDRSAQRKQFNKMFDLEKSQIDFQNKDYLDKKKKEEDAWAQFNNPYDANSSNASNTTMNSGNANSQQYSMV